MSFETTALVTLFVALIVRISIGWVERFRAIAKSRLQFDLEHWRGNDHFAPLTPQRIILQAALHDLARRHCRPLLLVNYRETGPIDVTPFLKDGTPGTLGAGGLPLRLWGLYKAPPDPCKGPDTPPRL